MHGARDRLTLHLVGGQVEIKTTQDTPDGGSLQKAADFVHAFILGADFLGIVFGTLRFSKNAILWLLFIPPQGLSPRTLTKAINFSDVLATIQ